LELAALTARPSPLPGHPDDSRWATAAHLVSLAVAFVVLLYLTRGQWFTYDEWEFLAGRIAGGQNLQLFTPHSEHWSTLPLLIFWGLYRVFRLRTYTPYIGVLLAFHVVLAHLVWRLMRRNGSDPWIATTLAVLFLFLGAGYENVLNAFQISFVGSALLGFWALLLVDREDSSPSQAVAVWVLLVGACMFSGIGVTMTVAAGMVALFRRGWRSAITTVALPAVVYLLWLALFGRRHIAAVPPTPAQLLLLPDYVWTGLTHAFDDTTGLVGTAPLAVLGVALWLWRDQLRTAPGALGAALGAVALYTIIGIGRISLGVGEAATGRYVYLAFALMLPAIGVSLTWFASSSKVLRAATFVVLAACATQGLGVLVQHAHTFAQVKQASEARIVASQDLLASGETVLAGSELMPDPVGAPDLTVARLRLLQQDAAFPPHTTLSEGARFWAQIYLQVALDDHPRFPMTGARMVDQPIHASITAVTGDCLAMTSDGDESRISVRFSAPASWSVLASTDGSLGLYASMNDLPNAPLRTLSLPIHRLVYVDVNSPGLTAALSLPRGDNVVCGLAPP
jgi:hypothetical protein